MRRSPAGLAAALSCLLLVGCSAVTPGRGSPPAEVTAGARCPDQPVAPAADRPVIDLDFSLAADRTTVSGVEKVRFTPDIATDELVFRLTANQPGSVEAGTQLTVNAVTGTDVGRVGYERAGAAESTQGGLLVVGLDRALRAGQVTEVEVTFELRLGQGGFDRFGHDARSSWWGSGQPLLAWEPGVGWARDPLVGTLGETATSPAADTTLTVSAPEDLTVLMSGVAQPATTLPDGRKQWRSTSETARDVSVAVGQFGTAEAAAGDTAVTVGTLGNVAVGPLVDQVTGAIRDLERYFGPFPFPSLTVAELQDYGGGIEYPSSILLGGSGAQLVAHEVAHQWFYGMVGDDQARDPWLDEAFAAYAEGLVNGSSANTSGAPDQPLAVGLPIEDFSGTSDYFSTVYGKGSAALAAARAAAGAAAFDAAIRCYITSNAWQIATPADVRHALDQLPAAVTVLVQAGALR